MHSSLPAGAQKIIGKSELIRLMLDDNAGSVSSMERSANGRVEDSGLKNNTWSK